jgi:hypothetical protein
MAAGATYEPIATTTLGSATQTVTFSSISQSYTDLVIVINNVKHSYAGSDTVQDNVLQFNSDTGSNYSFTQMNGDGSSANTTRAANLTAIQAAYPMASATAGGTLILNVQNYSNSTTYKTVLIRTATPTRTSAYVDLWRNTAAITSMVVGVSASYTMSAGTVITLYGIAAA